MATIFNPINKPIADQIDVRQRIMAGTVTNQHARNTYLNKACVVKLVPLVKDTTGITQYNDFVFDNFTLTNNFFNTGGFKYNDKVEKPFIQNIEITSRSGNNYGATRTGKLVMIIPTKKQFNLIERYFRIGTAFLLEWGWGKYVNNDKSVSDIQWVEDSYYKENEVDDTILENVIIKKRTDNQGNYDGGIFYITNFTTNIQNGTTDYYYELTLNIVSKGDILNSLKPSIPVSNSVQENTEEQTAEEVQAAIDSRIKKDPIINWLTYLEGQNAPFIETTSDPEFIKFKDNYPIKDNYIQTNASAPPADDPYSTYYTQYGAYTTQNESVSYVKLRYILNLLQVLIEKGPGYIEDNQEYVLPDYTCTIESDSSYYRWAWNPYVHFASFNPTRVILPHYFPNIERGYNASNVTLLLFLRNEKNKIGSILIRTKFLIDEISNLIKNDQYSFNNILDFILKEINKWTDNELNLIKYDIDGKNQYSITSLKSADSPSENLPILKLYGIGSIVEQTDIDTVISNELSSQVAIMMNGAANYEISSQAISLLKFNNGIESRLKRQTTEDNIERKNPNGYLLTTEINHINSHKFLFEKTPIPNLSFDDNLNQFKKFKQDYTSAIIDNNKYDDIQGTPLFPIKIRTTLPGISGIAIGNKLQVEDVRLPDIYTRNNVYYVVTNQQSKIDNRYWQTFLDLSPQINTLDIQARSTQGTFEPQSFDFPPLNPIDFDKLLAVIRRLESGGFRFAPKGTQKLPTENDIEEGPVLFERNGEIRLVPLYSYEITARVEKRARGPYQLKPAATIDALEHLGGNDPQRGRAGRGNTNDSWVSKINGVPVWTNPAVFNNQIDTISGAKALAKAYLQRYQTSITDPNARTYLRLLSLYKLGTSALYSNTFIEKAKEDGSAYKNYLINGRKYLQELGVPVVELNDPFIQANILPDLPVLQ